MADIVMITDGMGTSHVLPGSASQHEFRVLRSGEDARLQHLDTGLVIDDVKEFVAEYETRTEVELVIDGIAANGPGDLRVKIKRPDTAGDTNGLDLHDITDAGWALKVKVKCKSPRTFDQLGA